MRWRRDPNNSAAPKTVIHHDCTLREQIIATNTDAPTGACPAGAGADTIALIRSITLAEALPSITSNITIVGGGHTINGNNRVPIFAIDSGAVIIRI